MKSNIVVLPSTYIKRDISADRVAILEDDSLLLSTAQKRAAELKQILEEDSRCRRHVTATTEENIDRVHRMLMDDRRFIIIQIANTINIHLESVKNILHNELEVSAWWMPHNLTPDQKRTDRQYHRQI